MFDERATEAEIMDDPAIARDDLLGTLHSIERINRWLGGHRTLVDGVDLALATLEPPASRPSERRRTVLDVGCGGGDGLRALAERARRSGRALDLRGVDTSPVALELARARSRGFDEIAYQLADVLAPSWTPRDADVVTFNLCLHHFTDAEIVELLAKLRRADVGALLVNDLQRHWLPWLLFLFVCVVCFVPRVPRYDGLLSIRKGFRGDELRRLASAAGWTAAHVKWRWAFRHQVVLVPSGSPARATVPPAACTARTT